MQVPLELLTDSLEKFDEERGCLFGIHKNDGLTRGLLEECLQELSFLHVIFALLFQLLNVIKLD